MGPSLGAKGQRTLFRLIGIWKAHSGLPILVIIELFSLGVMVEALRGNIDWKSPFLNGVGLYLFTFTFTFGEDDY